MIWNLDKCKTRLVPTKTEEVWTVFSLDIWLKITLPVYALFELNLSKIVEP